MIYIINHNTYLNIIVNNITFISALRKKLTTFYSENYQNICPIRKDGDIIYNMSDMYVPQTLSTEPLTYSLTKR